MATADQLERQALARAAAAQQAYLNRAQQTSASGTRVSPDTVVGGTRAAGMAAGGIDAAANNKPWALMTSAEQKAALDKVDWSSDFFKPKPSSSPQSSSSPSSSSSTPATAAPVDTGTPSGGGGGGGGGGGAAAPVSNVDATSQLFADALKALQEQYGVSQENINAAIARMQADPYNTANAYATMQLAPARVAADPLAQYMQAAGLSDQQSAAAAQLSQAEADAYQQAMQNVQNVMSKSQEQANLSRLADIGLISTGAQQDLEANLNMLRLGLERDRIGALTGLQQQNLKNSLDMRNAIANQISSIFSGQDVAPESILKLIEQALAKINTNRWTTFPAPMTGV